MALVSLSNGKVIDVDLLWYLGLSDAELQDLVASNSGFETDNPFHGSALSRKTFEEEPEEEPDIPDVPLDCDLEPDDV